MKKDIRLIDLDCANCAAKIEAQTAKLDGVSSASVNLMKQRMTVEVEDGKFETVLAEVKKIVKALEPDVTVEA